MHRRTVLAGLPGAILVGGCTDILTQDQTTFEANRGVVTESARSDTSYQEVTQTESRSEEAYPNVDRTIVVINKLTEYARSMDLPLAGGGRLGRFTVLATPEVTVVPGEPSNPVADMDNDELAMTVQEKYERIENVRKLDDREAELFGEPVTVGRYRADAETDGESTEVHLHIARGESMRNDEDTDIVVCVGVNPSDIDERDRVDRLLSGVEHPA
jgi:hypothetical protein